MFNFNCWFRENFNIYCPGCGGTRMVKAILKFDFYQAFRYNPLIFMIIVGFLILFVLNFILILEKKKLIFPKEKHYVILAGIVVLYMLLRNIPIFDFLLPTDV